MAGHTTICVWYEDGWRWDDAEDHGGFDRISPSKPFQSRTDAEADAKATLSGISLTFTDGKPAHYA